MQSDNVDQLVVEDEVPMDNIDEDHMFSSPSVD